MTDGHDIILNNSYEHHNSEEDNNSINSTDILEPENPINHEPGNIIVPLQSAGKKREQNGEIWKRHIAKKLRNEGKEYVGRNLKVHKSRKVQEHTHSCRYNCNNKVSEEKRQVIFNQFWKLGSWELQNYFLNEIIELAPVKRKKKQAVSNKDVSCVYKLENNRVCKEFVIRTLDVSTKRLANIVNKKKVSTFEVRDRRGKKQPSNKIPQERIDIIKEHINSVPRYLGHYTRDPRLNLKQMYKLYQTFCQDEKHVEPVKESFYRYIFNNQFNLSFEPSGTETCDMYDILQITIDHCEQDKHHTQVT